MMGQTMPNGLSINMSNEAFRTESLGVTGTRDLSLKSLRNSADNNRQGSFLFNNKLNRKVKKTGTNRSPELNNTQPLTLVSQGFQS